MGRERIISDGHVDDDGKKLKGKCRGEVTNYTEE